MMIKLIAPAVACLLASSAMAVRLESDNTDGGGIWGEVCTGDPECMCALLPESYGFLKRKACNAAAKGCSNLWCG